METSEDKYTSKKTLPVAKQGITQSRIWVAEKRENQPDVKCQDKP